MRNSPDNNYERGAPGSPAPAGRLGRPVPRPGPRQILGRQGEDLAASALEAAGLEIVARNVRTRLGEVDLVARDGRATVFVEVKTRRGDRYGTGADAITWRKQERMRRLAAAYLGPALQSTAVRFDVVDVALRPGAEPAIRHIRGAF